MSSTLKFFNKEFFLGLFGSLILCGVISAIAYALSDIGFPPMKYYIPILLIFGVLVGVATRIEQLPEDSLFKRVLGVIEWVGTLVYFIFWAIAQGILLLIRLFD